MPTTANNETLERIKKNAWSQYPMIAMKARRSAYEDGAIYEHDKAIDDAIRIVKRNDGYFGSRAWQEKLLSALEALKSK